MGQYFWQEWKTFREWLISLVQLGNVGRLPVWSAHVGRCERACGWVEKVQGHQLWNDAKVVMIHNYQMVARKMFVNSLGCDKVYRLRCRNLFIGEVMYDTLTLGEVMSDTLTLKIGSLGTSPSLRPYAVLCNAPCYVPKMSCIIMAIEE
ncbi:uncharacterized protein [Procambarus clarkii]|uniref:uncharacterized protein isoform X3 n=1 Tax=Procambarus clarkii TaxID=6728 RepID=UPI003743A72A